MHAGEALAVVRRLLGEAQCLQNYAKQEEGREALAVLAREVCGGAEATESGDGGGGAAGGAGVSHVPIGSECVGYQPAASAAPAEAVRPAIG